MDVNFFYVNELFLLINVLTKNDTFTLSYLKCSFFLMKFLMADLKNNVIFDHPIVQILLNFFCNKPYKPN